MRMHFKLLLLVCIHVQKVEFRNVWDEFYVYLRYKLQLFRGGRVAVAMFVCVCAGWAGVLSSRPLSSKVKQFVCIISINIARALAVYINIARAKCSSSIYLYIFVLERRAMQWWRLMSGSCDRISSAFLIKFNFECESEWCESACSFRTLPQLQTRSPGILELVIEKYLLVLLVYNILIVPSDLGW